MQRVADIKQLDESRMECDGAFAELLRPLIEPGFRLALAMLRDPWGLALQLCYRKMPMVRG